MNEIKEMFNRLKQIPTAEESVVERLKGLESNPKDLNPNTPSVHYKVDYFWYSLDGKDNYITLDWCPKEKLMYVCAHWNSSPEFHVELAFRSGACSCIYSECDLREWPSNSQEFWEKIRFILVTEEDHVAKDGVIGH